MEKSLLFNTLLVNSLGHSAGVVIFGIFLYLMIQDRATRRLRGGLKSMLAATLALAWNMASLAVLATPDGPGRFADVTASVGFTVLSLLPAVLFDLSLQGRSRLLVGSGYVLASVAIAMHVIELFQTGTKFHFWALALITAGFGTLTCIAAAATVMRRDAASRGTTSRLVGTMSLFLLAMSFVHFGGEHVTQVWSQELAFHHAAIPLALLVLLQDYRFVLLDAFLRFLANVTLAAVFAAGILEFRRVDMWNNIRPPFDLTLELLAGCLVLILYAVLRRRLQALLTRLVFRHPDLEATLRAMRTPYREESQYLQTVASHLGQAMGAEASISNDETILALDLRHPVLTSELPHSRLELDEKGVEALVPLRVTSGKGWLLLLGRRSGGRRYLSEDLQALQRAADTVAEQVERYRESETRRLVAQAELRALQSQIHPHFLFNALNTLYGIIPREAQGARETVLNLADIFRYFLETRKSFLPLEEELRIVKAYLAVERLRLGEKLTVEMDVSPEALAIPIPILSLEPLVENAVKHGIALKAEGGCVRITALVDTHGTLRISVCDTGVGFSRQNGKSEKVGLENVTRRLELCYGSASALHIDTGPTGSTVSFAIPAQSGERSAALEAVI